MKEALRRRSVVRKMFGYVATLWRNGTVIQTFPLVIPLNPNPNPFATLSVRARRIAAKY